MDFPSLPSSPPSMASSASKIRICIKQRAMIFANQFVTLNNLYMRWGSSSVVAISVAKATTVRQTLSCWLSWSHARSGDKMSYPMMANVIVGDLFFLVWVLP